MDSSIFWEYGKRFIFLNGIEKYSGEEQGIIEFALFLDEELNRYYAELENSNSRNENKNK